MKSKSFINEDKHDQQHKIIRKQDVLVYQNHYIRLYDDIVSFPGGLTGTYLRLEWNWPYNVAIVPVTRQGKVFLLNQFCYARQKTVIQIPKGMGDEKMSEAESAKKELLEEIGGSSNKIEPLRVLFSDPGLIANPMHVFVAWDIVLSDAPNYEEEEVVSGILERSLDSPDLLEGIEDAITIASLSLARDLYITSDKSM